MYNKYKLNPGFMLSFIHVKLFYVNLDIIWETFFASDKLDIGFRGNLYMSELADRDHLKYNKTFTTEVVLLLFVQLKADAKKL